MACPREIVDEIKNNIIAKSYYIDHKTNERKVNDLVQVTLQNLIKLGTVEIYSEDIHFIFELLQNADDNDYINEKPSIAFNLIKTSIPELNEELFLHVVNNEKGFSEENIRSLCDINNSSKKNKKLGYIGEKGIGFKSVFKITKEPYLFSNGFKIKFPEKNDETELGYFVPNWIENIPTMVKEHINETNILLPIKSQKCYDVINEALRNRINEEILIFLNKIKTIEIKIADEYSEQIKIKTELEKRLVSFNKHGEKNFYWTHNYTIKGLSVIDEPKRKINNGPNMPETNIDERELMLAFNIEDSNKNGVTYCYLPTNINSGMPFIINADFILTTNRDDMNDYNGSWNLAIRNNISKAFIEWLIYISSNYENCITPELKKYLSDSEKQYYFYKFIPLKEIIDESNNETQKKFFYCVYDDIKNTIESDEFKINHKIIIANDGKYYNQDEVVILNDQQETILMDNPEDLPQFLKVKLPIKHEIKKYKKQLKEIGCQNLKMDEFLKTLEDVEWIKKRKKDWFYKLYIYLENNDIKYENISKYFISLIGNDQKLLFGTANTNVYFPFKNDQVTELLEKVRDINLYIFHDKLFELCLKAANNKIINWLKTALKVKEFSVNSFIKDVIIPFIEKSGDKISVDSMLEITIFLKNNIEQWKIDNNIVNQLKQKILFIDSNDKLFKLSNSSNLVVPDNYDIINGWQLIFLCPEDRKHFIALSNKYINFPDSNASWQSFFNIFNVKTNPEMIISEKNKGDKNLTANETKIFESNFEKSTGRTFLINYLSPKWLKEKIDSNNLNNIKALISWMNNRVSTFYAVHNQLCFNAIFNWYHYTNKNKTLPLSSDFYYDIKNIEWIPTTKGYKKPSEVVIANSSFKDYFGDSLAYLSEGIKIDSKLCDCLGIKYQFTLDTLVKLLENLKNNSDKISDSSFKLIVKIYNHFKNSSDNSYIEKIILKSLILVDKKNNIWTNGKDCIWNDGSKVFGDTFYYLGNIYSIELKDFFVNKLKINEVPDIEKYSEAWIKISNFTLNNDENDFDKKLKMIKSQLEIIYNKFFDELNDIDCNPDKHFSWWNDFIKRAKLLTSDNDFCDFSEIIYFDENELYDIYKNEFYSLWLPDKFPSNKIICLLNNLGLAIASKSVNINIVKYDTLKISESPIYFTDGFKKGLFYSILSPLKPNLQKKILNRLINIINAKECESSDAEFMYNLFDVNKTIPLKTIHFHYQIIDEDSSSILYYNPKHNPDELKSKLAIKMIEYLKNSADIPDTSIGANEDTIERFIGNSLEQANKIISFKKQILNKHYENIINKFITDGIQTQEIEDAGIFPDKINDHRSFGDESDAKVNNQENVENVNPENAQSSDKNIENRETGEDSRSSSEKQEEYYNSNGIEKENSDEKDGKSNEIESNKGPGKSFNNDIKEDETDKATKESETGRKSSVSDKPKKEVEAQGGKEEKRSGDNRKSSSKPFDSDINEDGDKEGTDPYDDSENENNSINRRKPRKKQTDEDQLDKLNSEKERKEKEIDDRKKIIEIKKKIMSLTKYSFEWFNEMLELEYLTHESSHNTDEIKISFHKIEKLSNNLIVLRSPSRYIPSNIEDLGDLRLKIHAGKHKLDLKVDVVSNRDNALKVKLLDNFQLESISTKGARAELEIKNLLFILECLKDQFKELDFYDDEIIILPTEKLKFIFGPPGTGKTTRLSDDIIKLMNSQEPINILALAPTNKAADVLTRKIIKQNDNKIPKWLIRFGNTGDSIIENNPDILKDKNIDFIGNTYNTVITTIARFPYDGFNNIKLGEINWDYVIFDEASMIFLPAMIYAIMRTFEKAKEIIIGGDPFQIQPIVRADEWENQNIYSFINLDVFEPSKYPASISNNIVPLTTQYRSISSIGTLFSKYKYDGILKHHRKDDKKKLIIDNIEFSDINIIGYPFKKDKLFKSEMIKKSSYHIYSAIFSVEMILKIVGELESKWGPKQAGNNSRFNESAMDDFNLEDINRFKWTIGVISPYKAQAMVIEKMLASTIKERKNVCVIPGTVHGFQGDECDIVIAVLNSPSTIPRDKAFINNENVINVAISRARDCLIMLVPGSDLENYEQVNKVVSIIKQDIKDNYIEKKSAELEKLFFGSSKYIKDSTFITSHQSVNVYSEPHYKYEIRTKSDDSIDIFVNSDWIGKTAIESNNVNDNAYKNGSSGLSVPKG